MRRALARLAPEELAPVWVSAGLVARFVTALARAEGITLGRRILVSARAAREIDAGSWRGLALLAHELAHVEQYRRLGLGGFLRRYFGEYLAGRRRGLSHHAAYRAISLEREARRAERRARAVIAAAPAATTPGGRRESAPG